MWAQVLHESRTRAPWAKQPAAAAALRRLADAHSLYVAPHGSNDDWYWMYAAVRAGARTGFCTGAGGGGRRAALVRMDVCRPGWCAGRAACRGLNHMLFCDCMHGMSARLFGPVPVS